MKVSETAKVGMSLVNVHTGDRATILHIDRMYGCFWLAGDRRGWRSEPLDAHWREVAPSAPKERSS